MTDRDAHPTREYPFVRDGRLVLRTVQEVVEQAVRRVVRQPVQLLGASRTDAGVHAAGQVAAFTCDDGAGREGGWPAERGANRLKQAINGKLPDDVLVIAAEHVADDFDPISDCVGKGYSYTLHVSRERSIWDRRYVHQVWETLDVGRMREAADCFVGEHDFAAFAAAGHGRLSTVRTIHDCRVTEPGDGRVRVEVSGNGFLYNMVRIIAGTLVEVGRGRIEPGDVAGIIAGGDRRKAGPTLPPTGLRLEWVRYEADA
jgi:tRNA pseudouridine38-40 synthase